MIRPQSLRIGSIVKLRDTGEIVRVCGITKRKVGFHAPNEKPNAHLRYRKFSEIEGVLIYYHWQKIETCGLMHSGWDDGEEKYLYTLANYPNKTFRFIHELQNLHYALTGVEISIDL